MIFPFRTPDFIPSISSDLIWKIDTLEKKLFLTFDDGPIEVVTPFVLDTLKSFNAQATFFCIGDNIRKHPEVFNRINEEGHITANHTYNHLAGWKTDNEEYLSNIDKCESYLNQHKKLFRPPYGRITRSQIRAIKDNYKIIMWDVLTGDFSQLLDEKRCLNRSVKLSRTGSIIVFHDSLKSERILRFVLPRYLEHFSNKGYQFESLVL